MSKYTSFVLAFLVVCAWFLIGAKTQAESDTADIKAKTESDTADIKTQTDSGLLWLVNKDNPLPPDFVPPKLSSLGDVCLNPRAKDAFLLMLEAMKAENISGLYLQSAYRTYEYQRGLFTKKVAALVYEGHNANVADALAAQTLQRPGASEHQTGLALDVTISGSLTQDFGNTSAGRWLDGNSHRYGFIIRYPQSKTAVTNIIYEPWHLRYVGIPHAGIMHEMNLTLEEYVRYIKTSGMYIFWTGDGGYFLVVYHDRWPDNLPDGLVDISAIGCDGTSGYIVTTLREGAEQIQNRDLFWNLTG